MNSYITDILAREHTDRLMAAGVAARRARHVRSARRAATRTVPTESPADRSPASRRGDSP